MIATRQYLDFLIKTGLTQAQLLLLHLLLKEDYKSIQLYKDRFPSEDNYMIGEYQTNDLIKQGWLEQKEDGKLRITDSFRELYLNSETAIDDLLNVYPAFIENKEGTKIPLLSVDKHVYGLRYGGSIMYSYELHKEVLELLKYGIENKLITFGVAKFIDSEYWKVLKRLKDKDEDPNKEGEVTIFENDF